MNLDEDIKRYLPQYLSAAELGLLKEELAKFTEYGTRDAIYTIALNGANYFLQGDGICKMPYLNFPNTDVHLVDAILMSNTCDMSTENKRLNKCRIMYAPIIRYDKYAAMLEKSSIPATRIVNHLEDIKAQKVSQILYLPKGGKMDYEGIVFFDRAISLPLTSEIVVSKCADKLFTLSNFGLYLFLLKMSIHFTRIQERINRTTGEDLGVKS